jgi:hypothetical protein
MFPLHKLDRDIRKARRWLNKIDEDYAADVAKLKKEKADADAVGMMNAEWSNEHDMAEDELALLLTKKLRREADELDIPLPPHPQLKHDDPDSYANEYWYLNQQSGWFTLKLQGRDVVEEAIWKKRQRRHDSWARWIPLGTGFMGTLIGLISLLTGNWDRLLHVLGSIWTHLTGLF